MGNALVTLILVTVVLVGVLTLASGSISSLDMISNSWKQMEEQMSERSRTRIDCVNATASNSTDETEVTMIVSNEGHVSLANFAHWDVIAQYYDGANDYHAKWLSYSSSAPNSNEWTVNEISFNGTPETIEPGILNSGEEMEIIARLDPAVAENTTALATVSTPNGVSSQIIFQGGG